MIIRVYQFSQLKISNKKTHKNQKEFDLNENEEKTAVTQSIARRIFLLQLFVPAYGNKIVETSVLNSAEMAFK